MKTTTIHEGQLGSEAYIKYLDNCRTKDFYLNIKQLTYDLLNIKEGDMLIDIGCGTGDDVRAMANKVGKSGKVYGICDNQELIQEAKTRSIKLDLPVEFFVCDAHSLPFPDKVMDGCRAERVFEHLVSPENALKELMRISKPGARIVITEPDLDTYTIDTPCDPSITRRIVHAHADSVRNGNMGRQLYRLLKNANLKNIEIIPRVVTVQDYTLIKNTSFEFEKELDLYVKNKVISEEEKNEWLSSLDSMQQSGCFFASFNIYIAMALT